MNVNDIEKALEPLRLQLNNHKLYASLASIDDIKSFMEQHVFAVWDFMSLLKTLQNHLTTTSVPWIPAKHASTARFINEIVHGEESDLNELGEPKSHFEMYLDAMQQVGANTNPISFFITNLKNGDSVREAAIKTNLSPAVYEFIQFTFEIIDTKEPHKIASAFTFGREDVIPDMFLQIINQSKTDTQSFSKLTYYLERHIELDGDEHGPLSLKMIEELCENNPQKWEDTLEVAKMALLKRIALWDSIAHMISKSSTEIQTY
ncbi:MAG: DUF3050 domain-containing protein [Psychroserpens sp.]|nr:DUF3050 domain-containing protein [Psychroserpens sp.]